MGIRHRSRPDTQPTEHLTVKDDIRLHDHETTPEIREPAWKPPARSLDTQRRFLKKRTSSESRVAFSRPVSRVPVSLSSTLGTEMLRRRRAGCSIECHTSRGSPMCPCDYTRGARLRRASKATPCLPYCAVSGGETFRLGPLSMTFALST